MKNIISIILVTMIMTSCEKVIEIDYKDNQSQTIIEGNITNEAGPYFVKISKSINLTSTAENPNVDNAKVTISDDVSNSEVLVPQGNGVYQTTTLVGTPGRTYSLKVEAENKVYTAVSKMPNIVPFDSIKVEENEVVGNLEYNLIPVYTDPIERNNAV